MSEQQTEHKVEEVKTPQVSININRSSMGDLTSIVLVTEEPVTEKQLAMILQALGNNILEDLKAKEQPVEEPLPVSGAV